ncbi:MAG: CarD family transcriptional regulator [Clostridium fessum]
MAMRPRTLLLLGLDQKLSGMTVKKKYSLSVKNVNSYQNGFELLISDLTRWKKEKYRVVLLAGSRTRASRLAGDLREYDLSAFCPDEGENTVKPGEILVTYGKLHRGFEYPLIKFVVITEGDMFGGGRGRKKKKKTSYQGKKIQSFSELSIGDYVVHESHGLGIYRGIEKIEQDKVVKDYIKIEYRDGGNLYLPATRLEGIQKYAGSDARRRSSINWAERNGIKRRARCAGRSAILQGISSSFMRLASGARVLPCMDRIRSGRGSLRKCSRSRRRRISWRRSRRQKRYGKPPHHGPLDLRRRWIWQDRDRAPGGV